MIGVSGEFHQCGNFGISRPDVFQIDRFAVAAHAERIFGQIGAHGAGNAIGNDEGRAGEIIGAQIGVHAGFEIAVTREHGASDEVLRYHRLFDLGVERTGGTHAGGAAISNNAIAKFFKEGQQTGITQVIGDYFGARGERSFNTGVHGEAAFDGALGEQAGGDQQRRVGGVGARRNRRDQHVAMTDVEFCMAAGFAAVEIGG